MISSTIQLEKEAINDYQAIRVTLPQYRVYPIRFVLLISFIILGLSNGLMVQTYTAIPQYTADYYHVSLSEVNWIALIGTIVSLVVGFITIAILDIFGLRTAVICGAILNLVGAILGYVSTIDPIVCSTYFPKAGYCVVLISQIFINSAQPFFYYSPTKLSNTWFGAKERGLSTEFAAVSTMIGSAVASLVNPYLVTETYKLPTLMWIYVIPAGVGFILSFTFYRSSPRVPPTPSGDIQHLPFFKGLKDTLFNLNFLILLLTWALIAGCCDGLIIIIPQYLCPYGYSDESVGLWSFLMIFFGLVAATISGILIGITKKYKDIGVGAFALTILSLIWFIEVADIENQPYLVAIPLCLFGTFSFCFLPVIMELGVEVTYPVAEATSSGLLCISEQISTFIFVIIFQATATSIDPQTLSNNQCGVGSIFNSSAVICSHYNETHITQDSDDIKPQNWSNTGWVLIGTLITGYVLFVIFFRPTYRRLQTDNKSN